MARALKAEAKVPVGETSAAATASADETAGFDYSVAAELFPTRSRKSRGKYRRFARAADAIRFAVEELSPELLLGAYLEVDEKRFGKNGIRRLYDSDCYPLARRNKRTPADVAERLGTGVSQAAH